MIIVRLKGGLGNQMFQYALGRRLALKYKAELRLDLTFLLNRLPRRDFVFRDYDLSIFNIKERFTWLSRLGRSHFIFRDVVFPLQYTWLKLWDFFDKNYWAREKKDYRFDERILNLPDNVYLDGYWQSYKYLEGMEDVLREDFAFKKDFDEKSAAMAEKICSVNSVCVNVRRQDYVHNPANSTFFVSLEIDYYKRAAEIVAARVANPHYFVFSDEIDWCEKNLDFLRPAVFVGHEYAGEKFQYYLRLMTLCKHFIISNSTFSWWSAWLSESLDKIVIAPKNWVRDPEINKNTDDLIPPDWIRI